MSFDEKLLHLPFLTGRVKLVAFRSYMTMARMQMTSQQVESEQTVSLILDWQLTDASNTGLGYLLVI